MKLQRVFLLMAALLMLFPLAAVAGDFDWMTGFNTWAAGDPSGFRAQLAARFKIGNAQIDAVLSKVGGPADAYMVFRYGEMCSRPPDYVLQRYKTNKGKGWGALAQSLGIKPGSAEFHVLKRSDDLHYGHGAGEPQGGGDKGQGRSNGHGNGQGKGKGKGK